MRTSWSRTPTALALGFLLAVASARRDSATAGRDPCR